MHRERILHRHSAAPRHWVAALAVVAACGTSSPAQPSNEPSTPPSEPSTPPGERSPAAQPTRGADVSVHPLTIADPETILAERVEDLSFLVERIAQRPRNVGMVHLMAWDAMQLAARMNHDAHETRRLARTALETGVGVFQVAYQDAKSFTLDGNTITYEEAGPADHANAEIWLRTACLAVLLEDAEALRQLGSLNAETLRRSPTQMAAFRVSLVDLFNASLARRETMDDFRAMYREIAADTTDDGHVRIPITFVDALIAIHREDADAFRASLEEHLEAHRLYWGSARWSRSPTGLISITASALVALANQRGVSTEGLESGYLYRFAAE